MTIKTALLILAMLVCTAGFSQGISLSRKDAPLTAVMKEIEKQTDLKFFYKQQLLKNAKNVTIDVKSASLESVLALCFSNQPVDYKIVNKLIVLSAKPGSDPEPDKKDPPVSDAGLTIPVTGIVTGANNQPLSGATVSVKGQKTVIQTDGQGVFLFNAPPGSTIIVSYVGHQTTQQKIAPSGQMIIRLEPNAMLDEAVIYNGYQKVQQKYLTGSVTSLKMDSVIQPGLSTVDKMLEGRIPGLTYMQNSGQSGAAPKLRIRGTSTILGAREPLWVVDGIVRTDPIPIPADRVNDPDFVNLLGNAIAGLNPNDIDQIDVLKDATAAALYGVRAANGVIVITTKRGKPGPPVVNYNVTGRLTRRPRYTDRDIYMMNSRERVDVSREMIEKQMTLRGSGMEAYEKAIADYYAGRIDFDTFTQLVNKAETANTDWMKYTMRDAFSTDHTLSVSGGSPSATYRASVGYNAEPGVIRKEVNDRYTGLLSLMLSYRKFKAEFNIQLNNGKRRYTPQDVGVMNHAFYTSRAIPLRNADGSLYYYSPISSQTVATQFVDNKTMNILNEIDRTGETVETSEYTASANLNYEVADGIQLNSTLAYTGGNSDHQTWFDENTEMAAQIRNVSWNNIDKAFDPARNQLPFGGELTQQSVKKQNYTINTRLDFRRFLGQRKLHLLTAGLGAEVRSTRNNTYQRSSRGYYPERGLSFANIDITKYTSYGYWLQMNGGGTITNDLQNAVRSFLTATHVYKDRYVVSGTTSQEFSNAFGTRSNEKFLPTWALSARWNMQDDLLRNASWIDLAALRVSYGTQGNMIGGQTPYTIITRGAMDSYYDSYASSIQSFPNPNLLWEKKQDYSAAVDFSILNGRIRGSLGAYSSKTTNAFLRKNVSSINGVGSYVVNGGTVENYGVEIDLHVRIINNPGMGNKRGFMWRFDPQLGQAFNKLINNNLRSRNVMVDMAGQTYENFLSGSVPVNGRSVNTFYSYQFKGLDPTYGFPLFYGAEPSDKALLTKKYNAVSKEEVFSMVMVESGRREPVLQGGINNTFSYRNWTLDINFTYSVGNKIRLLQIASGNYGTFRPSSQQNLRKEFVNRWQYPGDEQHTNIPGIQGSVTMYDHDKTAWWNVPNPVFLTTRFATDYYQMYDFSDLRVVKGDHIKLQYVSLQYMLTQELCKSMHIKGATVRLTGSNLFTIANKALRGQDPSQSGSAPNVNLSIRPVYAFNINLSF
ncbi:MAG: SusC/RagA family TonB-linked outer membrane protein [Pseudobacter sp.]|uniref:SusC/RagA family TonB-linked outer membrane protein n=1 Tax=Pseudobacter sp. TaxID=2045420 RepID=UPI003F7E8402